MTYRIPATISVKRVHPHIIEYSVTSHDPVGGDETRTYHANRVATFYGPWTGNPGRQMSGGAWTLWRATDADMLAAFKSSFGGYEIRRINVED